MEKKYTKYDAIDFAEEPSFIRWVKGGDQKATAFWEKWMTTHPEKKEELKEAKVLVQAISVEESEPSATQIKNLWDKIDAATVETSTKTTSKKTINKTEPTVIRSLNRRKWMSYAAAACIGLLAFFYFYNPSTIVGIGNGEHLAYTLPDNSKVELNADSKISFKGKSFNGDRIVNLEGEAFFEVEKGQSFKIITPNGTIEVLGTSFNVNTRDGNLEVDCRTGKVKVTAKGTSQILIKGQGTKLNNQKSALESVYTTDIAQRIGWRNGEFYYENVKFSNVIEELERQYDVTIECDQSLINKLGTYKFNGEDIESALKLVLYQLNATYKIDGNKVTITPK